jgi:hypothetical protein
MDGVVGTEAEKILPNRLGRGTFLVRHDHIAPRAVPWYSGTSQSTGQPGADAGKRVKRSVMPTKRSGAFRSDKRRYVNSAALGGIRGCALPMGPPGTPGHSGTYRPGTQLLPIPSGGFGTPTRPICRC